MYVVQEIKEPLQFACISYTTCIYLRYKVGSILSNTGRPIPITQTKGSSTKLFKKYDTMKYSMILKIMKDNVMIQVLYEITSNVYLSVYLLFIIHSIYIYCILAIISVYIQLYTHKYSPLKCVCQLYLPICILTGHMTSWCLPCIITYVIEDIPL